MILNLCAVIHDHTVLIICCFYGEVLNCFKCFHVFILLLCKALCAAFHVMKSAIQIKFIIIIITDNGCLETVSHCQFFPRHILCNGVVLHQTHEQSLAPKGNPIKVLVVDQRDQRFVVCMDCEAV